MLNIKVNEYVNYKKEEISKPCKWINAKHLVFKLI